MIEVRYSIQTTDKTCACETPCPRHVGVHPTGCRLCEGVVE